MLGNFFCTRTPPSVLTPVNLFHLKKKKKRTLRKRHGFHVVRDPIARKIGTRAKNNLCPRKTKKEARLRTVHVQLLNNHNMVPYKSQNNTFGLSFYQFWTSPEKDTNFSKHWQPFCANWSPKVPFQFWVRSSEKLTVSSGTLPVLSLIPCAPLCSHFSHNVYLSQTKDLSHVEDQHPLQTGLKVASLNILWQSPRVRSFSFELPRSSEVDRFSCIRCQVCFSQGFSNSLQGKEVTRQNNWKSVTIRVHLLINCQYQRVCEEIEPLTVKNLNEAHRMCVTDSGDIFGWGSVLHRERRLVNQFSRHLQVNVVRLVLKFVCIWWRHFCASLNMLVKAPKEIRGRTALNHTDHLTSLGTTFNQCQTARLSLMKLLIRS